MNEFILAALNEAERGILAGEGGPFGAVVVKDGKIVGSGHNRVLAASDATCHGEMEALRDASKNLKTYDLSGCVLYTTGYPCPMCLSAMLWANIRACYFAGATDKIDELGFRDGELYAKVNDQSFKNGFVQSVEDDGACKKLFERYKKLDGKLY